MGRDAAVLGLAVVQMIAENVREMLMERPAPRDVEELHAAADAEDRKAAPVGGLDQGELDGVHARLGRAELEMWLLAIGARLDIRTARQADAVDAVEQGGDRVGPQEG